LVGHKEHNVPIVRDTKVTTL